MSSKLFRVIIQVSDVERAAQFYSVLLDAPGNRISPGRHYFDCEGTILACFDPRADGDDFDAQPNPDHVYIAVDELESAFQRAKSAGATFRDTDAGEIATRPWGERSFYIVDPFGNRICIVDRGTMFTG
jgi:catechol 2,3-dioxygenase-like lactoylglutathione lyase family enzyme